MLGSGFAKCEFSRFIPLRFQTLTNQVYVCVCLFTDHVANLLLFSKRNMIEWKRDFYGSGISMMPHITYFCTHSSSDRQRTHVVFVKESNFNMNDARALGVTIDLWMNWFQQVRMLGNLRRFSSLLFFPLNLFWKTNDLNGFRVLSDERFKLNLYFFGRLSNYSIALSLSRFNARFWEREKKLVSFPYVVPLPYSYRIKLAERVRVVWTRKTMAGLC